MNDFGTLLKALRTDQGCSQEALAKQLLTSASTISKWENNASYPDILQIRTLSEIFQVSCDDLLYPTKTLQRLERPLKDAPLQIEEVPPLTRKRFWKSKRFYGCTASVILFILGLCLYHHYKPTFVLQEIRHSVETELGCGDELVYKLTKKLSNIEMTRKSDAIADDWIAGVYPELTEDILIITVFDKTGKFVVSSFYNKSEKE